MQMKFTYDFADVGGKNPNDGVFGDVICKERAKIFAYIEKLSRTFKKHRDTA